MVDIGLSHDFVNVVDDFDEACRFAITRVREPDVEIGAYARGISAQHHDAVGEDDGLFNIVSHDEDGIGRHLLVEPELEQFAAQAFGGKDIESGKWFVHEEDFGLDDQGTGETDALLHSAGKFLGICGFKTVKTYGIERAQRAFAAFDGGRTSRFEGRFHIFQDGEPGKQREALEDDGNVWGLVGQRLAVPEQSAGGRF